MSHTSHDESGHDGMMQGMQECIDLCGECREICTKTVTHCLEMGGKHASAEHITLLLDCADICGTSGSFMLRHSHHHKRVCDVCAEACRACAKSCRSIGSDDAAMKACADVCDRCAESCEKWRARRPDWGGAGATSPSGLQMNQAALLNLALVIWFGLTALSVIYVAWDAFTTNPEMKVMKWGFLLITLFTGPVGACVYVLSCKPPVPMEHAQFVNSLWKQAVGSTVHCVAGDATGIIAAAAVTMALGLVMWHDIIAEYVFGFAFGLLIFQALFMKQMLGGSYVAAVRKSFLPEWLSMNAVMAGMIPVMVVLMSRDMASMHPSSLRFWGVMSLATMVGFACAYPVNYWLVAVGLKHGMGTVLALGDGGHSVSAETGETQQQSAMPSGHAMPGNSAMPPGPAMAQGTPAQTNPELRETAHQLPGTIASSRPQRVAMTLLTLLALAGGLLIAALGGDLAMRGNASMPHDAGGMEMKM